MKTWTPLLLSLACLAPLGSSATACPFCSAVSQTFSEEIAAMDVVVVTRLAETPTPPAGEQADAAAQMAKSKFEVVRVIKGEALLKDQKYIETLYFGQAKTGETFLVMGADPPSIMWSTPLLLSENAETYISKLQELPPEKGRLKFFLDYLEHPDDMLARDAYDEFAKAPYDEVKNLKPEMNHDQLIAWIKDKDIPVSRRRLYLTLLGICGSESDTDLLEGMLRSEDRADKAGLDALIACYLMLEGPDGMQVIEELYLKNPSAEYADTYSAIMALRFHGTEANVIPRDRLLAGLRHMLDRPELADLVIPDLARWEDWSVMDRLVELFKNADESSSWVRVPVINYLRACPLPNAQEKIDELAQVDPEAVKRANTFFPFATANPAASAASTPAEGEEQAEQPSATAAEADPQASRSQTPAATDAQTDLGPQTGDLSPTSDLNDTSSDPSELTEAGEVSAQTVSSAGLENSNDLGASANETAAAVQLPSAEGQAADVEVRPADSQTADSQTAGTISGPDGAAGGVADGGLADAAPRADAPDETQVRTANLPADEFVTPNQQPAGNSDLDPAANTGAGPSVPVMLGVPAVAGLLLLGLLWFTLRGSGSRSTS